MDAYSKFERVIDDHAATGGAAICGRSFWDASGAPDLDSRFSIAHNPHDSRWR